MQVFLFVAICLNWKQYYFSNTFFPSFSPTQRWSALMALQFKVVSSNPHRFFGKTQQGKCSSRYFLFRHFFPAPTILQPWVHTSVLLTHPPKPQSCFNIWDTQFMGERKTDFFLQRCGQAAEARFTQVFLELIQRFFHSHTHAITHTHTKQNMHSRKLSLSLSLSLYLTQL